MFKLAGAIAKAQPDSGRVTLNKCQQIVCVTCPVPVRSPLDVNIMSTFSFFPRFFFVRFSARYRVKQVPPSCVPESRV